MTDSREPMREPAPELTTSRVRSGRSPWMVALVALAVLGTVIYIGVSGHDNTPDRATVPGSPPAVAALPSPPRTPATSAPERPTSDTRAFGPGLRYPGATVVDERSAPQPQAFLGTQLEVAGRIAVAMLIDQDSGGLHAAYRVPLPAPTTEATVRLVDVDGENETIRYGSWSLPVGVFHGAVNQDSVIGAYGPTVLVAEDRPPDSAPDPQEPRISRNGFSIQVTGQPDGSDEIVNIDVVLRSDPAFPNEQYRVVASAGSRSFVGVTQDSLPGHFRGEIVLPQRSGATTVDVKLSALPLGARDRVLVVNHRFAGQPLSAYATDRRTFVITKPGSTGTQSDPGIVTAGYRMTLLIAFDGEHPAVFYDVLINPTSNSAKHHWVTGDDGLVGWPSAAASL